MDFNDCITASELATLLKSSVPSIYRQMKEGPPRNSIIDVRQIPDVYIGGKRFWSKSATLALLEEGNV